MTDDLAPIASFQPLPKSAPLPAAAEPNGIRGWLVLPAIGLFGSVGMGLVNLANSGELFRMLGGLNGGQEAVIVTEILLRLVLGVLVPIYLLVLMFNKRRAFPRHYIAWIVATAIFLVADLLATYAAFSAVFDSGNAQLFDGNTAQAFVSAAIGLCIWVPYMLSSKRVQNTFVN